MSFADWISEQIDALRAMIIPDDEGDDSPGHEETVQETRSTDKVAWKFPSSPANLARVRKSIEKFCGEAGLDAPACDEIGLVVNEALANVMRHAYQNAGNLPVEMDAVSLHPGVRISIRDWGNGVNPTNHMRREKDPLVPGGLGLICIRKLMDDMEFIPQSDGMLLVMTRNKSGSKAAEFDEHAKHPDATPKAKQ